MVLCLVWQLVRPAVGNETDPEYFFCIEMLELPWYYEKWEECKS